METLIICVILFFFIAWQTYWFVTEIKEERAKPGPGSYKGIIRRKVLLIAGFVLAVTSAHFFWRILEDSLFLGSL